jgi:hypothetical protein
LFTPRRIKPELFEFINTPLNLEICRAAPKHWDLARWIDSIAEAVVTGAVYSSGFPLNSEESCNDIGQVYYGPVVLVTDALSYSTTDMFAAGFQDNGVGVILGTSDNTGAGGANVWWYEDLVRAVGNSRNSPFKPLPKGADMLVAVRRSMRVGRHSGRPLEELGIMPDERHYLTRRDILKKNEDLIAKAARILKRKPAYSLSVKPFKREGSRGVVLKALSKTHSRDRRMNISRVDVYIDRTPYESLPASDGSIRSKRVSLSGFGKKKVELLLEAYDGTNNIVAAWRKRI